MSLTAFLDGFGPVSSRPDGRDVVATMHGVPVRLTDDGGSIRLSHTGDLTWGSSSDVAGLREVIAPVLLTRPALTVATVDDEGATMTVEQWIPADSSVHTMALAVRDHVATLGALSVSASNAGATFATRRDDEQVEAPSTDDPSEELSGTSTPDDHAVAVATEVDEDVAAHAAAAEPAAPVQVEEQPAPAVQIADQHDAEETEVEEPAVEEPAVEEPEVADPDTEERPTPAADDDVAGSVDDQPMAPVVDDDQPAPVVADEGVPASVVAEEVVATPEVHDDVVAAPADDHEEPSPRDAPDVEGVAGGDVGVDDDDAASDAASETASDAASDTGGDEVPETVWGYVHDSVEVRGLTDTDRVIGELVPGQWYAVLQTGNGWAHVVSADGSLEGWADDRRVIRND